MENRYFCTRNFLTDKTNRKNKKMKKLFLTLTLFTAAMAMTAQDEVLQKYTEMGDVSTTFITKNRLEQMPLAELGIPGMEDLLSKIETMKMLVSMGDKAGKAMGTKLPKQLVSHGYNTLLDTEQGGKQIRLMRSTKDPHSVVIIVYQKPKATVVSLKGNFEGL